jgi:hypothetical protein
MSRPVLASRNLKHGLASDQIPGAAGKKFRKSSAGPMAVAANRPDGQLIDYVFTNL